MTDISNDPSWNPLFPRGYWHNKTLAEKTCHAITSLPGFDVLTSGWLAAAGIYHSAKQDDGRYAKLCLEESAYHVIPGSGMVRLLMHDIDIFNLNWHLMTPQERDWERIKEECFQESGLSREEYDASLERMNKWHIDQSGPPSKELIRRAQEICDGIIKLPSDVPPPVPPSDSETSRYETSWAGSSDEESEYFSTSTKSSSPYSESSEQDPPPVPPRKGVATPPLPPRVTRAEVSSDSEVPDMPVAGTTAALSRVLTTKKVRFQAQSG